MYTSVNCAGCMLQYKIQKVHSSQLQKQDSNVRIQALREVRIHDSLHLKYILLFLKKQTSNVYIVTRGKICFLLD